MLSFFSDIPATQDASEWSLTTIFFRPGLTQNKQAAPLRIMRRTVPRRDLYSAMREPPVRTSPPPGDAVTAGCGRDLAPPLIRRASSNQRQSGVRATGRGGGWGGEPSQAGKTAAVKRSERQKKTFGGFFLLIARDVAVTNQLIGAFRKKAKLMHLVD